MKDNENIKEERFTTIKIEDRTAFEDNQLDFWECECKEEPAYMYNVDGEYRKTLVEFWNHYNQFPLKVVHTRVWNMDDNQDYDKVYKLRIDVIQSIQELNQMMDEVGWKLVDETFFITNSSKPIQLKTYPVVWSRKLMGEKPLFELGPGDTLTEVILHGNSFLIGTQDHSLSTKKQVEEMILQGKEKNSQAGT
ncbi:hypothetical protein M3221_16640 [Domibacillus indicus]|uniref:hypothetical protein n=1 Tax=Domibacillus indicus TaxID=1437523 RepID=UPI00203C3BC9|nr:hypothetical protein [Domibacillus indicus]MCM3790017.1 hypothetical protein [Domibacillus indicus]